MSIPNISGRKRPEPMVSEARLRKVTPQSLPHHDSKDGGHRIINIADWLNAVYGEQLMSSEQAPSFETTTKTLSTWLVMHQVGYFGYQGRNPEPDHLTLRRWEIRRNQFVIYESLS